MVCAPVGAVFWLLIIAVSYELFSTSNRDTLSAVGYHSITGDQCIAQYCMEPQPACCVSVSNLEVVFTCFHYDLTHKLRIGEKESFQASV